jgi:hypothetical protein
LNPYDLCVANAIIDGKQCTIGWYVDDNIITHIDPNAVTWVIDKIEEKFGKMVVTRGKSMKEVRFLFRKWKKAIKHGTSTALPRFPLK